MTGSFLRFVLVLLAASAATYAVRRWRLAVNARTGEPAKVGWWAVPVFVLVAFWGAVLVGNGVTTPELEGRLTTGGMTLQPEYFALLVSLVIYTASHIVEIVRGRSRPCRRARSRRPERSRWVRGNGFVSSCCPRRSASHCRRSATSTST
ncbi:MAG: hypothetical protein R2705_01675 [Ilumatobacteraceae bacterium]